MSLGSASDASQESKGQAPRQRWRVLDDPLAIRALAHPVRTGLLDVVGRLGLATTAQAAREFGISHGLASHHLRQLAKYGFVERVAGKDNRERPWRLVTTSYSLAGATQTPEGRAAVDVLEHIYAEQAVESFLSWQRMRGNWPDEWRDAAGIGWSTVYLTQPELAELTAAIDALLLRYVAERPLDDLAARPPGSVAVDFTIFATPGAGRPSGLG